MKLLIAAPLAALFALASACSPADSPAQTNTPQHHDAEGHDAHKDNTGGHDAHKEEPKTQPEAGHNSHKPIDDDDFNWDKVAAPAPKGAPVELNNEKDPVTLKPAGAVTLEYKGFIVRFESEATRAKFAKKPLKFLNMLGLEPHVDGSVERVDATTYQDAVTDLCPMMPESEVDPHGTVYILHRGWKVFFCCWTGCGDKFMKSPAKYYDYYGLAERDGKLVRVVNK